ncbi:5-oxoprolinase subunit B family protein [Aureimonas phyllosphaerae]|uniref:Allophanate hydrolase subunit 1 n=1 Tax=Aureimonas phyllosphaerae TaxID=1166078 RepID=A0A7W6BU48_9HYPH|nr:carboxyltransferase domain-containing protein [Aureimonas phyllosphaerae]MBB3936952.1 allophanate hydrolase subunit 1 [Aureimonas phyllosphaerae]MBB3960933.1 allophanate hydrolase subunit 1 [Aureimonas phyllosphaerae]SFF27840.1 Allophanate hydrolase subunit 1 [Aureimonas phyllosphaerae]
MSIRFSFGGDEHIFGEVSEEMSLASFFTGLSMTKAVRDANIPGVTEICPANASFQIRFDPDKISPQDLLKELQSFEAAAAQSDETLETRIIELPVYFQDPWTHETGQRFRERHQDPSSTDLEYSARINGYATVEEFIAAYSGQPWFVSMVGFVAGLPWLYQMVERQRQIEAPKYLRPRTDTPKLTIGHGGCFAAIYSVRGAGGYQMYGVTPAPIYDPTRQVNYLRDEMCLFKPGDIVKFKAIDRAEYDATLEAIEANTFAPTIRPCTFNLAEFNRDIAGTNAKLMELLDGR